MWARSAAAYRRGRAIAAITHSADAFCGSVPRLAHAVPSQRPQFAHDFPDRRGVFTRVLLQGPEQSGGNLGHAHLFMRRCQDRYFERGGPRAECGTVHGVRIVDGGLDDASAALVPALGQMQRFVLARFDSNHGITILRGERVDDPLLAKRLANTWCTHDRIIRTLHCLDEVGWRELQRAGGRTSLAHTPPSGPA
jgi:hypothetical protein